MDTVSIERCKNYEYDNVYNCVEKLIDNLGGWKAFIKPGDRVAVKPNLLRYKKPEEAATTHPAVVKAIISQVQSAGGNIIIAESPGGPYSRTMLRHVYRATGIEKVADETGAVLNYDLRVTKINRPQSKYVKSFEILKPLADADVIINIPKLKTHAMMVYTGAVKNMFGAVAGTAKADLHLRMPEYNDFADSLIDIYLGAKPAISIMDAVEGMEGYGPSAGTPKHIGLLLASSSGFALDVTAAKIIRLSPDNVPVLRNAKKRDLVDENNINIIGENIENVICNDFDIPALYGAKRQNIIKRSFLNLIKKQSRPKPVISAEKCARCGNCVKICPAAAFVYDNRNIPSIDYKKCIRCFCCHELCDYKAVDIRRGVVSRLMTDRRFSGFR
ncbi:MAG: DUF362 domain-containing protein [Clostridiaceae bacterium]|mgnify:CR=1 FL=1|jgi:uncharacterized protein (DUF362 family)|nr:DUF362 domain-containing protein [Clostridiaceae bacterium]